MTEKESTDNELLRAKRLEYQYLREENQRLRDGRGALTHQLGPLPIGAAVVAGLVAGLPAAGRHGRSIHHTGLLVAALVVGVLMVLVSIFYSRLKPYRELRADHKDLDEVRRDAATELDWYTAAIKLEEAIYRGRAEGKSPSRRVWPTRNIASLQDGYDRERIGLYLVQGMFAVVVILLVTARVA